MSVVAPLPPAAPPLPSPEVEPVGAPAAPAAVRPARGATAPEPAPRPQPPRAARRAARGAALRRERVLRGGVALLVPALGLLWLAGESTVVIDVDGRLHEVSTHADDVATVLARNGVVVRVDDLVHPGLDAPLRDGLVIEVARGARPIAARAQRPSRAARAPLPPLPAAAARPAGHVTVLVDGHAREVPTADASVGELLSAAGVLLGPLDRVAPGVDEPPPLGGQVVVQRVVVANDVVLEPVAPPVEERRSDALPAGTRRVVERGAPGTDEVVFRVTRVDGAEESREEVSRQRATEPTPRVVEVGTGASTAVVGRTQTGIASWYDHPRGGMTAAHRTLPFGTRVTVTNLANGKSVTVVINDRGPFIPGRIIDLDRRAFQHIASVSGGVARVRISW